MKMFDCTFGSKGWTINKLDSLLPFDCSVGQLYYWPIMSRYCVQVLTDKALTALKLRGFLKS